MSLTYGFYNSLNGDRKYDATQFGSMFDGLISDGVFATIGEAFIVTSGGGLLLKVGTGKAWFNRTWTLNDSVLAITAPASEVVLDRIDAIVLDIDSRDAVRENSIKYVTGTPSSTPTRPTMVSEEDHWQYPLCYITRAGASTEIVAANIENAVGTEATPFVIGFLKSIDADVLFEKWQSQFELWMTSEQNDFDAWFENVKGQLSEDAAGNLQVNKADRAITQTVIVPVNWTGTGPYTQTVNVFGLVDTGHIFATVDLSAAVDVENALAMQKAWNMVNKVTPAAGSVTITCFEDKPSVAFKLRLEVMS